MARSHTTTFFTLLGYGIVAVMLLRTFHWGATEAQPDPTPAVGKSNNHGVKTTNRLLAEAAEELLPTKGGALDTAKAYALSIQRTFDPASGVLTITGTELILDNRTIPRGADVSIAVDKLIVAASGDSASCFDCDNATLHLAPRRISIEAHVLELHRNLTVNTNTEQDDKNEPLDTPSNELSMGSGKFGANGANGKPGSSAGSITVRVGTIHRAHPRATVLLVAQGRAGGNGQNGSNGGRGSDGRAGADHATQRDCRNGSPGEWGTRGGHGGSAGSGGVGGNGGRIDVCFTNVEGEDNTGGKIIKGFASGGQGGAAGLRGIGGAGGSGGAGGKGGKLNAAHQCVSGKSGNAGRRGISGSDGSPGISGANGQPGIVEIVQKPSGW